MPAPCVGNVRTYAVAEWAADGSLVGLTATSSDPNGPPVTFSLTDDAGGRFAIDATTGVVTVADGTLRSEERRVGKECTVQGSDGAGGTSSSIFTIAVSFVAPSAAVIRNACVTAVEACALPICLVGLTATSSDPNGPPVTFSLTDDAGGRFAIDATTGVVTVADGTLLNYEDHTSQDRKSVV